jgi:hypothetical protein
VFLTDFISNLRELAISVDQETVMAEYLSNLTVLKDDLHTGKFPTLPLFSRNLRLVVSGIEAELDGREKEGLVACLPRGVSVSGEFLVKWTALVPRLTAMKLAAATVKNKRERDVGVGGVEGKGEEEEGGEDEHVEQEGCPDENDFNKYVRSTYMALALTHLHTRTRVHT